MIGERGEGGGERGGDDSSVYLLAASARLKQLTLLQKSTFYCSNTNYGEALEVCVCAAQSAISLCVCVYVCVCVCTCTCVRVMLLVGVHQLKQRINIER